MNYKITIDKTNKIGELCLYDTAEYNDHLKARDELIELCHTIKITKILIDARSLSIRNHPSTMELFNFGSSWAKISFQMPILLAGVIPRDKNTKKLLEFGDTVALNRGFITRAFEDVDEARLWLINTVN